MSSKRQLGAVPAPADPGPSWQQLLGAVRALFVAFDAELTVTAYAGGLRGIHGPEPVEAIGQPLAGVLPGAWQHYEPQCRRALAGETATVAVTAESGTRSYELEFTPWRAPDTAETGAPDVGVGVGAIRGAVATVRDITALKQAEHTQTRATELFETAFADAPIGLALVGLDGRFMRVNDALCELLRYSESELLSASFQEITHPDDLDDDVHQLQRLIAGEIERVAMSKRYLTKDGDEVWSNLSVSLVRDDQGRPAHFVSQIEDISERKRLEIALQHLADHDHLTELWNRRAFEQHLTRQIAQCRRHATPAALLIVDLDDFKAVNDTHGHAAGDALLLCVARALRARLRGEDCVARIGGDEFAVILPDATPGQAAHVARVLTEEIGRTRIRIDELDVGVTASVGVTCLGQDAPSQPEAMAAADRAMYADKLTRKRRL